MSQMGNVTVKVSCGMCTGCVLGQRPCSEYVACARWSGVSSVHAVPAVGEREHEMEQRGPVARGRGLVQRGPHAARPSGGFAGRGPGRGRVTRDEREPERERLHVGGVHARRGAVVGVRLERDDRDAVVVQRRLPVRRVVAGLVAGAARTGQRLGGRAAFVPVAP